MPKTRKEEMREQVEAFHQQHPIVWDLFKRFTFEVLRKGFKNYSVNAIFERIRWEQDVILGTSEHLKDARFKLNNNYRAFYARRFMAAYPQHDGFFRTRKQTSEDSRATNLPELTPAYYEDQYR